MLFEHVALEETSLLSTRNIWGRFHGNLSDSWWNCVNVFVHASLSSQITLQTENNFLKKESNRNCNTNNNKKTLTCSEKQSSSCVRVGPGVWGGAGAWPGSGLLVGAGEGAATGADAGEGGRDVERHGGGGGVFERKGICPPPGCRV